MLRGNQKAGFLMQRNLQDNMTRYYDEPFEQTITRHGRNGMPYAIPNENRYVPSNVDRPRTGSRGHQDTPEQDSNDVNKQNQRRRIPIAVSVHPLVDVLVPILILGSVVVAGSGRFDAVVSKATADVRTAG